MARRATPSTVPLLRRGDPVRAASRRIRDTSSYRILTISLPCPAYLGNRANHAEQQSIGGESDGEAEEEEWNRRERVGPGRHPPDDADYGEDGGGIQEIATETAAVRGGGEETPPQCHERDGPPASRGEAARREQRRGDERQTGDAEFEADDALVENVVRIGGRDGLGGGNGHGVCYGDSRSKRWAEGRGHGKA